MTSTELRAFLNERSDGELHAAISIAKTILAARRQRDEIDGNVIYPAKWRGPNDLVTICSPWPADP